jgi:acyl dehydratase
MSEQIWFEDFTPGRRLTSGLRMITLADIDAFAALTGVRHPVHMDEAFARAAGYPGRIAHGLFALALIEGLKAELGCFERSVVASLGWDRVRFHAPLLPGDRVRLELAFVDRRLSSKPGRGVATERGVLLREDGAPIASGDHVVILLTRPAADAQ